MDIQALLSQLIPFLMELISGFVSMASSMASENSGTLKAGAAASIIAGAALSGGGGNALSDRVRDGVSAVRGTPNAAAGIVRGATGNGSFVNREPTAAERAAAARGALTGWSPLPKADDGQSPVVKVGNGATRFTGLSTPRPRSLTGNGGGNSPTRVGWL